MNCTYIECEGEAVRFADDGKPGFGICQAHAEEMDTLAAAEPFNPGKLVGFWVRAQGGAKKATARLFE
ncbi:hypothetical protein LCGC14_1319240 [marine sediment metagenome]|uniref:Uncharacterized protein n=1 Tax=marine sediment metagenome TaxID=412755 RepID=A0A0F9N0R6_9ZZZZ